MPVCYTVGIIHRKKKLHDWLHTKISVGNDWQLHFPPIDFYHPPHLYLSAQHTHTHSVRSTPEFKEYPHKHTASGWQRENSSASLAEYMHKNGSISSTTQLHIIYTKRSTQHTEKSPHIISKIPSVQSAHHLHNNKYITIHNNGEYNLHIIYISSNLYKNRARKSNCTSP